MFTRMLAPLALVVAGTMQPPLMVQEPTLHPVCIWQSGDYEDVVDGLMQCGDVDWDAEKRAVHALSEHERRHGWGGRIGGTDMIPASANVPCPARALEFFLQLTSACAEGEATWVQLEFADVLARNGRTDDALTVLNFGAHVRPSVTAHWYHGFFFNDDRWIAAHVAANIAAQAGRWEDALRFSQEWRPTGGCGNCMESEQRRIELFRAQCLVHLQRWGELRAACIDNLNDSWSSNSLLVGPWIDSYLLSGEAPDPETAVSILLPFVDARQCSRLDGAAEEWKLLHLPKAQQVIRKQHSADCSNATSRQSRSWRRPSESRAVIYPATDWRTRWRRPGSMWLEWRSQVLSWSSAPNKTTASSTFAKRGRTRAINARS
jgi:hypothetical protein